MAEIKQMSRAKPEASAKTAPEECTATPRIGSEGSTGPVTTAAQENTAPSRPGAEGSNAGSAVIQNGEPVVLPLELESNHAQKIIAFAAVLAICYVGKLVFVTLMFALLLAFIMEPFVEAMERIRIPRAAGALVMLAVIGGVLYAASYFSYVKAQSFVHELPKYTDRVKDSVLKFRRQTQDLQNTSKQLATPEERNAIPVKDVAASGIAGLTKTAGSLSETILAVTFIPFLAFFMVTWRDHMRASAVRMFSDENRTTAYVALGRVAKMLRAFITGNVVVGLIMGVMSVGAFWWAGVPYFYFLGFISGFLSLVPYLGVLLAVVPPLAAGMGQLNASHMLAVAFSVFAIHLFAFNVLYPKLLGSRLQLNPLVVTMSLLVWGFLWGAMGLILAVPIMAAIKIVCDHVESLRGLGELMGE